MAVGSLLLSQGSSIWQKNAAPMVHQWKALQRNASWGDAASAALTMACASAHPNARDHGVRVDQMPCTVRNAEARKQKAQSRGLGFCMNRVVGRE
jgi:hypothetical protein